MLMTREVLRARWANKPPMLTRSRKTSVGAMTPSRLELRKANIQCLRRRWLTRGVSTPTPVAERWVQFWANHFCVAALAGTP
ncbi:MAG: DUF1800 family protein [Rhodoferax sp.]|nr:DUF1800 family protein [Rhodoferax sp.]